MWFNRLALAAVALAASAAAAAASELPSFNCGAPGAAISWSNGSASQPSFYDAVSGATDAVGCAGADFVQVIARKSGEGQQDILVAPLSLVDDGQPVAAAVTFDLKSFHRLVDLPNAIHAYESYFDIRAFAAHAAGEDPFAELFLGLKITTFDPFEGGVTLQWNADSQLLSVLIPPQAHDATLRLTGAPSAAPEPQTWAVLTVGLAATGLLLRRRRGSAMKFA
jgi:hypothetical protein